MAHAQALQTGLLVADNDPDADLALLNKLAAWAIRYTPLAAIDPPDGLWLDVTGCAHLFGGEARLLDRLLARFAAMGFAATAAIADTPGAAHAVARFAGGGIVPAGQGKTAIEGLPIAALRLSRDLVEGLQGLGFTHISQLITTPAAPLVRRFGMQIIRRLQQALGEIGEPIEPVEPPPMPRVRRSFLEPIATAESLAEVAGDLSVDLCAVLADAGLGARRVDLIFYRIDGARLAVRIGTAQPSRDPAHLTRLLVEQIDRVEPGLGIEAMELTAPRADPQRAEQSSAFGERPDQNLAGLVDRLANRLGERVVWRAVAVESHIPERSLARTRPLASATAVAWPPDLPRPVRLIDPPERVEVMAQVPDYPPAMFRWRGRRYHVRLSDGLERIFSEWWTGGPLYGVRDYFRVEVEEGGRYWLFRARDEEQSASAPPEWFIHGAFA